MVSPKKWAFTMDGFSPGEFVLLLDHLAWHLAPCHGFAVSAGAQSGAA